MGGNILLVDDDLLIHQIVEAKLRHAGYGTLLHAYNGQEAIKLLEQNPALDLILTDLRMPQMGGLEVIEQAKALAPDVPVVVISAFADQANLRAAMKAGAFDFTPKPLDLEDLSNSIKRALEQRRRELAARTEKDRFLATLNLTEEGLMLFDSETRRLIYANQGALQLTGLSAREQESFRLDNLLEMDQQAKGVELTQLRGHLSRVSFKFRPRDKNLLLEAHLQLVELIDGERRLVLNLRDVSAEEQLKRHSQMLATAVEQARDMIVLTDPTGKILYVNPAFETKTGFTAKEAIGENPRILKSGRHSDSFYRQMWQRLAAGEGWQGDFVNRRKDGQLFYAEATISPMLNDSGQITQYVGVSRDRTRERRLQAQLLQSQKMESIGTLAGGIAHEINNPVSFIHSNLATLQGYLEDFGELLQLYGTLEESAEVTTETLAKLVQNIRDYKEKIDLSFLLSDLPKLMGDTLDGANRVKKIIQNLREFSHTSSGEMERTDLIDTLEKTLKLLHNEIKYRITINKEFGELPPVRCQAQEISQVFLNLLLNAAQAIEGEGSITLKTWAEKEQVVVQISDTGSGIAPENLPRLFEPFFTTKEVGRGTGLGLSVSYNIIKQHNGRLEAESTLGEGATFRVILPLEPEKAEPDLLVFERRSSWS